MSVILLAGGKGARMNSAIPKQFCSLKGKSLALYSFEMFIRCPLVEEIVIVCAPQYREIFSGGSKELTFAFPGERRQDSVYNGLKSIRRPAEYICVHDTARPFIYPDLIEKVHKEAISIGAATLAIPLKFAIKEAVNNRVVQTVDRSRYWEIQTPQIIKKCWLEEGFEKAFSENYSVVDDVGLVELLNYPVGIVKGDYRNIKITTPEDLDYAEFILMEKRNATEQL